MDEQLLIARCKKGESSACKQLYELYSPIMFTVCIRYLNNRETARDVLQEGFIKVFTRLDSYSGKGAFGGWIRRIFVTTSLEYLRQKDTLKMAKHIDEYEGYSENVEESIIDQLSADDIMSCIAQLPDGFRTVFNLFAIEGYTHNEIAEMLDIKESTSRSQYVRAKKVLQEMVQSLILNEDERQRQI